LHMRIGILAVALLWMLVSAAQAQTTRCYLPGREDRVTCITLKVPLDWRAPKGKQISVFAAVIPALSRSANSDPLFLLPGGPGQSGDALLQLLPQAFRTINQSRDLVLIYPRGTARSTLLRCTEPESLMVSDADIRKLVQRCAAAQKVDTRFFTSIEIAQDMEAVRKALGYARINIWGGSFGTRLAQHYAKTYPVQTRSLILDGATPITESVLLSSPRSMEQALASISQACKQDKSCAAQMPNLLGEVRSLAMRLSARPQRITLTHPATLKRETVALDARSLVMAIRLSLYAPQSRAMLPPLIKAALAGNYQPFAAFASGPDLQGEAMSMGAHLSAMCAEDVAAVNDAQIRAASGGTLLGRLEYQNYQLQCAAWPHRNLPASARVWTTPKMPVLVLSGALDPVTPPALGTKTAALFASSRHIIVPASGHISSGFGCAPKILQAFLDDLEPAKLDIKCLLYAKPPTPLSSANG
jgi:pimeloyl-ACP methyl ester carboxylesterase